MHCCCIIIQREKFCFLQKKLEKYFNNIRYKIPCPEWYKEMCPEQQDELHNHLQAQLAMGSIDLVSDLLKQQKGLGTQEANRFLEWWYHKNYPRVI